MVYRCIDNCILLTKAIFTPCTVKTLLKTQTMYEQLITEYTRYGTHYTRYGTHCTRYGTHSIRKVEISSPDIFFPFIASLIHPSQSRHLIRFPRVKPTFFTLQHLHRLLVLYLSSSASSHSSSLDISHLNLPYSSKSPS